MIEAVDKTCILQAEIRAGVASDQCARFQHEILQVQKENSALQEEVIKLRMEVISLEETKEVTTAAVESLESTLAKIERSCTRKRTMSPPPARIQKALASR